MGALILSTGLCSGKTIRSSIACSVIAGQEAMKEASVAAEDVDLVINVGIYRDKNMVEPAMAALIQKELGMNPDYIKAGTGKNAFSLDLLNGGIGALNAMQVANSFLQKGAARHVLIVGADSHPSNQDVKDFPYNSFGAAFLLGKGNDERRGFQSFEFSSELRPTFGRIGKVNTANMGTHGRSIVSVDTDPDYIPASLQFSSRKAKEFVKARNVQPSGSLLISSQLNAEFADSLGKDLGFAGPSIANLFKDYGDAHTSSFGLGYRQFSTQAKLKPSTSVLFVGASPGLSVGCVHYVC